MTAVEGLVGWVTCPCGKRGYPTRPAARRGDPRKGLHRFPCPTTGLWHNGHIPEKLLRGHVTRRDCWPQRRTA